jgi:hypothetical protein
VGLFDCKEILSTQRLNGWVVPRPTKTALQLEQGARHHGARVTRTARRASN